MAANTQSGFTYEESLASERRIYDGCLEVHALPPIFHYWSNRHLREKLIALGFHSIANFFTVFLERQCGEAPREPKRFLSLGSGNCDLELALAGNLHNAGHGDFTIECVDLNPTMLERGAKAAAAAGLAKHLTFAAADLNQWHPEGGYHAVIANQSLHHVINLEGLFEGTKRSLLPGGCFVISDMIGRNGHLRWPEALAIVQEFWRRLPPSYRFNRKGGGYEETFQDWDCSGEGFEGVRSQDILPLLLRDFHFELFLPFGNAIDPFIDRSFGFNFDAEAEWDRNFIDEVHRRDEEEIASGRIKPTHMLAVAGAKPRGIPVVHGHLTPEFCVRHAGTILADESVFRGSPYEWQAWSRDLRRELETIALSFGIASRDAARHAGNVVRLERELSERTAWALELDRKLAACSTMLLHLDREHHERTVWGLELERQLKERTAWALQLRDQIRGLESDLAERTGRLRRLEGEYEERTQWALGLERQVEECTGWAVTLQRQLDERTAWALQLRSERDEANERTLQLQREVADRAAETSRLQAELRRYLRNPLAYFARVMKGVGRRLAKPDGDKIAGAP